MFEKAIAAGGVEVGGRDGAGLDLLGEFEGPGFAAEEGFEASGFGFGCVRGPIANEKRRDICGSGVGDDVDGFALEIDGDRWI